MKEAATRHRILIVEDDPALRSGVSAVLEREGFEAVGARDGEVGLGVFGRRKDPVDLVILDLMLPGIDGLAVLKAMRRQRPEVPVLVLSAKGAILDKVALLDAGADDYVVKPFDVKELLARIRALFKRYRKTEPLRWKCGGVQVDLEARQVTRDGRPVHLSARELSILDALVRRAGAVVTREEILDRVWGYDPPDTSRAVDYHVLGLRRKLEEDPSAPRLILTEPGIGYRVPPGEA
jgi:DNA-binding response OmpR family regulator